MVTVAVDVMSAEKGLGVAVPGVVDAVRADPELEVILVGDEKQVRDAIPVDAPKGRVHVQHASQVIAMDDEPGQAFKSKKDASISVATRQVAEGKAGAVFSPGNTGASTAAATFILKRLPGVRRPAIMTPCPTSGGFPCALLDTGAVVDARPEDLVTFGIMGSSYVEAIYHKKNPSVGLLSIGEEDKKGNEQSLQALSLLRKADFNFVGNVEGGDVWDGSCDVVVCDGFVGNVVLKTAEGIGKMLMGALKDGFEKGNLLAKAGAALSKAVLRQVKKSMDPDEYGGCPLLGVNGVFIITHGSAGETMLKNGTLVAGQCVRERLVERIKDHLPKNGGENA